MSDANEIIEETVKSNEVVLFMKGTKTMPQCGFSNKVSGIRKIILEEREKQKKIKLKETNALFFEEQKMSPTFVFYSLCETLAFFVLSESSDSFRCHLPSREFP